MSSMKIALFSIFFFVPLLSSAMDCGSLQNHYGPFDYRDPANKGEKLNIVERAHFSDVTFSLALRGASAKEYFSKFSTGNKAKNTDIPNDIDYTLRAFPNHPMALYAMLQYQRQRGQPRPGIYVIGGYRPVECYFVRARQFAPDDGEVLLLYGIYLHKEKEYKKALEKYREAERLMPEDARVFYNMGLLYYDLGELIEAQAYADKAYAKGYPMQGLKNKLQKKVRE